MFNEDRRGFTVKDILIQLLFVVLLVFIMIWLFPTKNNMSNVDKKLDILTSTIFNTNLQTMKEAAVSYYTVERLPQTLNSTDKMTLNDMLDKKLLVDFVDGNGNSCDKTASYVEVIKLENEYQMKVNLSCTDRDAYIIVHLGCYDYCKASGVCEKKEEPPIIDNNPPVKQTCSYEYLKVTNGKWGDYGNWTAWSTTKVSETDYRKVEVKTEKVSKTCSRSESSYLYDTIDATPSTYTYCQSPYTEDGKGTCSRTATGYYTAKCPSGYTLNSDGTCTGTVATTTTTSPVCPDSTYSRTGTKCYKEVGAIAKDSSLITCPSGYTLNSAKTSCTKTIAGNRTCVKGDYITTLTGSYVPADTTSYIYEAKGNAEYKWMCNGECGFEWIYTYDKYKAVCTGGSTTETATPICSNKEYSYNGSTCVKGTTQIISVPATCKTGVLDGEVCKTSGTVGKTVAAACPTGFKLEGNKCYGTQTVTIAKSTSKTYSCPTVPSTNPGYKYTLSGTKCTRTIPSSNVVYYDCSESVLYYRSKERSYISGSKTTQWSTSQNDSYLLGQGFALTGNKKCSASK